MNWLRLHTSILESVKIQSLPAPLFKAWTNLLCISRIFDGVLPSDEEIAFRLRVNVKQATRIIDDLVQRSLIDRLTDNERVMHDWGDHQYDSDSNAERQRAYRKRLKERNALHNGNVPEQSRAEQIQSRAESEAERTMPPISQSEYPLTIAEIRRHDPAVDDLFVLRLVQESTQALLSSTRFPQDRIEAATTDKVFAAVCAESYKTGPKTHGTGLLLKRVPGILMTWGVQSNGR